MDDEQSRLTRDMVLKLTRIDTIITKIKSRNGIVSSRVAPCMGESKFVAFKYHNIHTHTRDKREGQASNSICAKTKPILKMPGQNPEF